MREFKNGIKVNRIIKLDHHESKLHAFPNDEGTGCWVWFGFLGHMYGIFIPRFRDGEVKTNGR